MEMPLWRIFVASSSSGLRFAQAIKAVIDKELGAPVCFLWNQGSFETGKSFLESLEQLPVKYNGGLAVFTADDRFGDLAAPRDNVVLEFGLMLGAFGRRQSFLLVEERSDLKLPSDYEGITVNKFFSIREESSKEEHCNAVFNACAGVVERLRSMQPAPQRPEALQRIEMNWRQRYPGQEFKLFSFYGLCDPCEDTGWESNEEDVYYLWADAGVGSSIRARMIDEARHNEAAHEHILQVEFCNALGGFPGNVAIRLQKRRVPSAVSGRFQRLRFMARVPPNPGSVAPETVTSTSIGIRVVDALTTHWEYCRVAHEYRLMTLTAGDGWKEFKIALNEPASWSVFQADGNYLYHDQRPDFSQILALVVEVGSKGAGRAGSGSGVVQLKDFQLE